MIDVSTCPAVVCALFPELMGKGHGCENTPPVLKREAFGLESLVLKNIR